jgi:hypothetical protein
VYIRTYTHFAIHRSSSIFSIHFRVTSHQLQYRIFLTNKEYQQLIRMPLQVLSETLNLIMMTIFPQNQYFDYCRDHLLSYRHEATATATATTNNNNIILPTFNKNYSPLRAHSHHSFLSKIDENGYDNDDNTSSEEATNTNKVNNNKNNVVNFLNIITIYVIMMIIIGGTAIIATEKGTESMMVDILLDAKYNHKQEGNITMRRRKQLLRVELLQQLEQQPEEEVFESSSRSYIYHT